MCLPQPPRLTLLGAHERAELTAGEVQLWLQPCADLPASQLQCWHDELEPAEQAAVAALRFEADRRAYVTAHVLRRIALAQMLRVRPETLRFGRAKGGRPLLHGAPANLFFSLSHCRQVAACAVTRLAPVGVDVEARRPEQAEWALLQPLIALNDEHAAQWRDVDRTRQFYLHWTALEAYWKAMGRGIAEANSRIAYLTEPQPCTAPNTTVFTVGPQTGADKGRRACIFALEAGPDCAVAVALACDEAGGACASCICSSSKELSRPS